MERADFDGRDIVGFEEFLEVLGEVDVAKFALHVHRPLLVRNLVVDVFKIYFSGFVGYR